MSAAADRWERIEGALGRHLERWGRPAPFWLRDDDAVAPSPALDRLLSIAASAGVPVSLAVIPARAEPGLRPYLDARPDVAVLQHGHSHANHAPQPEKKAEFGAHRSLAAMRTEIAEGRRGLAAFSGFVPIFVPPWNRIAPQIAAELPGLGLPVLSTFGERRAAEAAPGLAAVNTHLDPIAWHAGRGFVGAEAALDGLALRLERLADGLADPGEPTGLLTHHLAQDEATFAFLDELLRFLARKGLTTWLSGAMLLERSRHGDGKVAV